MEVRLSCTRAGTRPKMADSDVFEALRLGVKFDSKRFKKDVDLFQGRPAQNAAVSGEHRFFSHVEHNKSYSGWVNSSVFAPHTICT